MIGLVASIISVTLPIILACNLLAGLAGGIWLVFLGQWRIVASGVLFSLLFPKLYLLITLPIHLLVDLRLISLAEKRKRLATLLVGALSLVLNVTIMLAWLFIAFAYLIGLASVTGLTGVPFVLFGYSCIVGPFTYMASQEPRDSVGTYLNVCLMQIAYIVLSVLYFSNLLWLSLPLIVPLAVMFQAVLLQISAREFDDAHRA